MLQVIAPQHRDLPVFFLLRSSWLEGSGRLSLGTRCITVVFPAGSPSADNVTFPWRNRPWYINRRISALETDSSSHSGGQLSKTNCAISPALSLGLNRYSLVFPLTRINRKFILSWGTFLEPRTGIFVNLVITVLYSLTLSSVLLQSLSGVLFTGRGSRSSQSRK